MYGTPPPSPLIGPLIQNVPSFWSFHENTHPELYRDVAKPGGQSAPFALVGDSVEPSAINEPTIPNSPYRTEALQSVPREEEPCPVVADPTADPVRIFKPSEEVYRFSEEKRYTSEDVYKSYHSSACQYDKVKLHCCACVYEMFSESEKFSYDLGVGDVMGMVIYLFGAEYENNIHEKAIIYLRDYLKEFIVRYQTEDGKEVSPSKMNPYVNALSKGVEIESYCRKP